MIEYMRNIYLTSSYINQTLNNLLLQINIYLALTECNFKTLNYITVYDYFET